MNALPAPADDVESLRTTFGLRYTCRGTQEWFENRPAAELEDAVIEYLEGLAETFLHRMQTAGERDAANIIRTVKAIVGHCSDLIDKARKEGQLAGEGLTFTFEAWEQLRDFLTVGGVEHISGAFREMLSALTREAPCNPASPSVNALASGAAEENESAAEASRATDVTTLANMSSPKSWKS